jgi:hypothetical protein
MIEILDDGAKKALYEGLISFDQLFSQEQLL